MGTPSNSHASSPAHHWRNPNWSPTFPNIASGRKALTFTWLIFPKTMSDNQRVSGWSVLCFRTPTITTPVRRCIKPQTAGAFLFFSSDSPKNCATKQIGCGFFLNIGSGAFSLKSQAELFKVGLVLPLESNMKTARTITEWSPLLSWPSIQPVICKLQTKSGISPKNTDIWTISWATPSNPGGYLTPRKGCLNRPENCFVVIFFVEISSRKNTYLHISGQTMSNY